MCMLVRVNGHPAKLFFPFHLRPRTKLNTAAQGVTHRHDANTGVHTTSRFTAPGASSDGGGLRHASCEGETAARLA